MLINTHLGLFPNSKSYLKKNLSMDPIRLYKSYTVTRQINCLFKATYSCHSCYLLFNHFTAQSKNYLGLATSMLIANSFYILHIKNPYAVFFSILFIFPFCHVFCCCNFFNVSFEFCARNNRVLQYCYCILALCVLQSKKTLTTGNQRAISPSVITPIS